MGQISQKRTYLDTKFGRLMVGDIVLAYFKKGKAKKRVSVARIHSCDPVADFDDKEWMKNAGYDMFIHEFEREDGTTSLYGMRLEDVYDRVEKIVLLKRSMTEEEWRVAMDKFSDMLLLFEFEAEYQRKK